MYFLYITLSSYGLIDRVKWTGRGIVQLKQNFRLLVVCSHAAQKKNFRIASHFKFQTAIIVRFETLKIITFPAVLKLG